MTGRTPWPETVNTPDDVMAIEALARVERTACGAGDLVWHVWGEGRPVVLLHGGSGSWTHWVRNLRALVEAGRQVLVPDLPGFGDSAAPPDGHDADVMPGWIERGLDALLGGTPFDLVGFSFGGLVAGLLAAGGGGARVERLVLVGAPALASEPMAPLPLRAWHSLPEGPRREAVHRHNLGVLMLHDPDRIDGLAVRLHADNLARDRMRQRRLMRTDLLLRTLPSVQAPVHGLWGAEDVLYRDRLDVVRRGLAQAPRQQSLVFIEGAGHWVQFERAPAFDAALAAALGRSPRSAPG